MEGNVSERQQSSAEAGPSAPQASPRKPSDIFDQENFDATAYINEMFPTRSGKLLKGQLIHT